MSKLLSLFKISLVNSLGINKILKEKSKGERIKFISILIAMIFSIISISFSVGAYSYLMANELEKVGLLEVQMLMGFISSAAVIFFTSIYKAQGILFSSKDYDLLMSLPIKTSTILLNKMLQLLGLNYFVLLFTFIPVAVIYFMKTGISVFFFIYLFLVFIFLPLIPIVLSSIIAFVISYISSKLKYKNLIINSLSIIFLLLIMLASFKSQDLITKTISNSSSIASGMSKIYPPTVYAVNALTNLSIKDLFIFISISIVIFSVFIFIFHKSFKKINSKLQETFKKSSYKMRNIKASSKISALVKKEIKRYFASPIYVLNTIIGPIILLLSAIVTLFFGKDVMLMIMKVDILNNLIPLFLIAMVCGILTLSCTTNSSISLEGKNLWILKSSPIKAQDIFKGKLILNLILILPALIISNIIFFISLKLSALELLQLMIITIIYSFIVPILGLMTNLYFPKLNWTTETAVVKQGISVLLQMLISVIIVGLPTLAFILLDIKKYSLFIVLVIIYLMVTLIILWRILNTIGVKLFNRLH